MGLPVAGVYLLLITAMFYINGVTCDLRFILSQSTSTWPDADAACRRSEGTLAVLNTPKLQEQFSREVNVRPGEHVWLGRYVGYTPIVAIEGCYSNRTLTKRSTHVLRDNSLASCLAQCTGFDFIGLQGTLCYCMDGIPPGTTPLIGTACRSRCPGEGVIPARRMSQCGMQDQTFNSVSVYRKVGPSEITLSTNVRNQGECISYTTKARAWQAEDCGMRRLFTCKRMQCFLPYPQCILESRIPTQDTWFNGRARCEDNGAQLSTINSTNTAYYDQKLSTSPLVYWTGLHRKELIVWSSKNPSTEPVHSAKCVGVLKRQDGNWDWQIDWCDRVYRYVCLQDFTPPTTTKAPTPAPTTRRPIRPSTARPTTRKPQQPQTPPTTPPQRITTRFLPVNVTSASSSPWMSFCHVTSAAMGLVVLFLL